MQVSFLKALFLKTSYISSCYGPSRGPAWRQAL